MERLSFAKWRLPGAQEAVLLRDDHRQGRRFVSQERHSHDEMELHFVDRGRGVLLVSSGRLSMTSGTLVWIPPGRDHLLLESSPDFRRWMLLCRRRMVRRVVPDRAQSALLGRSAAVLSGQLGRRAVLSLRSTYEDVAPDRRGDVSVFNAGVAFLLARSFRLFEAGATRPEPVPVHRAVAAAVRLLREEGPRPSLFQLAARAGVSQSHLSKLFSAELGVSITAFRNRVGLERFFEAYGDGTEVTVLDAAFEAGFGSYPQFHRVFRAELGMTPAAYRKTLKSRQHRDA